MQIHLPNTLKRETMYGLLTKAINNDMEPKDRNIELDFRTLRWIEPSGVTVLSNLVQWLDKQGVMVILTVPGDIPKGRNCPVKYLDDSMFFVNHTDSKEKILPSSSVRPTTLPLQWVSSDTSYQWVDVKFAPWLSRQLGVHISTLGTIKMCILEILNNIRDHAQEQIGCIFAQHYPSDNSIKINISDFGVGIPNTIRKVIPDIEDDVALKMAIIEGVTSQSLPSNRGAGLHTLLENVVLNNGGTVKIHSNYGILSAFRTQNGDIVTQTKLESGLYPGTFIEIELKTDTISFIQDDFEEVFEW